jgi:hypothetical protein
MADAAPEPWTVRMVAEVLSPTTRDFATGDD